MTAPNLGGIAATTARKRAGEFADAVTENNALLAYIKAQGGVVETVNGGKSFLEPLIHAEVGNTKFYDGGMESFAINTEDLVDASEWERKFQAGFIYFTESERQANRGKEAALRLIDGKMKALKATLANDFSTALFDGSTTKEVVGLQTLVADDPDANAAVGGINPDTYAFWENKAYTGTTASNANIITLLDTAWLDTLRGQDKPNLLVAGNDMFSYYQQALQADQRFTSWEKADVINFDGLRYQGAMMIFDPHCSTKRVYGLDTNAFKLFCDSGRKWSTGSEREVTNALYEVVPILWSGALAVNNRARHFVINGT